MPCDVTQDTQIDDLFNQLQTHWQEGFDIVVHSLAYAPKEELMDDLPYPYQFPGRVSYSA